MTLQIAEHWFEHRAIGDGITLLWEPNVIPLMRCNIWHVRGRDRDLLIDTGLGVASVHDATRHLIEKPVVAVATHTHLDHVGAHHEFEESLVHVAELAELTAAERTISLRNEVYFSGESRRKIAEAGYEIPDGCMITALPAGDFDPEHYRLRPARRVRAVRDGDAVDTGDRHFEILHLPGHSPGSIGLWEAATGTLFSGDAVYDGPLLDQLEDSNVGDYRRTMERLRQLPVEVVHGGHDPSFGRARLIEIIDHYLASRAS
ncbi:MAG TPA: MBL fold metallo-hydrolase [Candidatus Cybelea sp.]|nr:MBL fold metallo-hydrolase [Candidatus Cybelea sp.]